MTLTGKIHKFMLDKLYGFVLDASGAQYFFHSGDFIKGGFQHQPPPLMGETVEVELSSSGSASSNRAVRALSVNRLEDPKFVLGVVEYYDEVNTYGFIRDADNVAYYLHKSEILDKATPKKGQKVKFYAGINKGKPRACYVNIIK